MVDHAQMAGEDVLEIVWRWGSTEWRKAAIARSTELPRAPTAAL